jgi:hypothetical protein
MNEVVRILSTSVITYVLVLPGRAAGDESPLQGFSYEVLEESSTLRRVLMLPATALELCLRREQVIIERAGGMAGYQIVLLEAPFLERLPRYPAVHFLVLISSAKTDDLTAAYAKSVAFPVLHVTTTSPSPLIGLGELTVEQLREYCGRATEFMRDRCNFVPSFDISQVARRETTLLPVSASEHLVSLPNEIALESLGYQLLPPAAEAQSSGPVDLANA